MNYLHRYGSIFIAMYVILNMSFLYNSSIFKQIYEVILQNFLGVQTENKSNSYYHIKIKIFQ